MENNQTAKVTVEINDRQAEEKLKNLERKATGLRAKFAKATEMGDTKGVQRLNKEITRVNGQIDKLRTRAAGVRAAMQNLDKATPNELRRALKLINQELNSGRVARGSREWNAYVAKLREVKGELRKVQVEMNGVSKQESLFSRIRNGVNSWGATAAAAVGAFTGVVMSGRAAVKAYADMDAEQANVRKYTGMTADEVEKLNEAFRQMDTRTSREDLNRLAQEAGRLGKTSMEDILGFVRAADQINVALDDLGEGATLTLSKLSGIFGDEARYGTEQSMLKIGSVINELSQNCSASAPYLAEFSSRLGGIAAQSKMTISQVMAFGAVLDTNNLNVEAASTAVGQLMTKMFQDPAKIARAAGIEVTKFTNLVKNDMNGALIFLFEQLNKKGGMSALASVFDEMGTDGARAIPVLTALAGHVEELKKQQEAASVAFAEGTSVGKEFNVQNTTVQAMLDKAKNKFNDLAVELGERLLPVMRYCISGTSMFMKALSATVSFIVEYKAAIIAAALALAGYTAAVKWHTIALTFSNAMMKAVTASTKAFTLVGKIFGVAVAGMTNSIQYLTNGLNVNYTMQQRWQRAWKNFKSIGIGWLGIILALIPAVIALAKAFKGASTAQEELKKIKDEAAKNAAAEIEAVRRLERVAMDANRPIKDRIEAINQLNRLVPQYNALLDETTGKYRANQKALDDYVKSLVRHYELVGAKNALEEMGEKIYRLRSERIEVETELAMERTFNAVQGSSMTPQTTQTANIPVGGMINMIRSGRISALERRIRQIDRDIKNIVAAENQIFDLYGAENFAPEQPVVQSTATTTSPTSPTTTVAAGGESEATKALKKELEERKKAYNLALADNILAYIKGERSYREYCDTRTQLEQDYVDDILVIHQRHNLIDAEGYQQALNDKAALLKKAEEDNRKESLAVLDQRLADEKDLATQAFYDAAGEHFQDTEWYNRQLLEADLRYLNKKKELYAEGSEERAAIERQIDELNEKDRLDRVKSLAEAVQKYREEHGDRGRAAAYAAEISTLDSLHNAGLVKEKEYQDELARIRAKYREMDMSETFKAFDRIYSRLATLAPEQIGQYDDKITEWFVGLSDEEREAISQGFEKGFGNGVGTIMANALDGMMTGWELFADKADMSTTEIIEKAGELAQNVANMMGGVLSTFSNYWNAERDVRIAAVTTEFDKEIEAAGNNSKKRAKLEKQKEEEIAKVKSKYNNRAMKVEIAQAIAQTAANALGAYGAMVKIPVVGPALAAAAAAAALAAGMIQVATIRKQHEAEAAGYYEGGYTGRDRDNRRAVGVVHANEFVANHKAVANPALAPVLDLIDSAQRSNTVGSLTSADVSRVLGRGSMSAISGSRTTAAPDFGALAASAARMADVSERTGRAIDRLSENIEGGIETYMVMDGERGFAKKYDHYRRINANPKR